MTTCPDCGKANPADIHTCSPSLTAACKVSPTSNQHQTGALAAEVEELQAMLSIAHLAVETQAKRVTAMEAVMRQMPALEQPQQEPEPVAWMYHGVRFDGTPHDRPSLIWRPEYMDAMSASKGVKATPLYAAPPQRKPLDKGEIARIVDRIDIRRTPPQFWEAFARAVEAAHGIGGDA